MTGESCSRSVSLPFFQKSFVQTLKFAILPGRRWINSTVHNLAELMTIQGLCGCCGLFGMRAIVFVDLLSTVIAPVTIVYVSLTLTCDTESFS